MGCRYGPSACGVQPTTLLYLPPLPLIPPGAAPSTAPPGDTVTCIFDSETGVLCIGVNDLEPVVCITGIQGPAYPATVFYAGAREVAIKSLTCVRRPPGEATPVSARLGSDVSVSSPCLRRGAGWVRGVPGACGVYVWVRVRVWV